MSPFCRWKNKGSDEKVAQGLMTGRRQNGTATSSADPGPRDRRWWEPGDFVCGLLGWGLAKGLGGTAQSLLQPALVRAAEAGKLLAWVISW